MGASASAFPEGDPGPGRRLLSVRIRCIEVTNKQIAHDGFYRGSFNLGGCVEVGSRLLLLEAVTGAVASYVLSSAVPAGVAIAAKIGQFDCCPAIAWQRGLHSRAITRASLPYRNAYQIARRPP